jgi:hypothetical protein
MSGTPFYSLAYIMINGEFNWHASALYEHWFVHAIASDINFEI